VNPPSSCPTGNACTGVVNVWNPTGCPDTTGCAWQETIPSGTFYVDAKIYSQQSNIAVVQVYLDQVKQNQTSYGNVSFTSFHSAGIAIAAGSNHRIAVQALDPSSLVIAKTVIYINAADAQSANIFSGIDDTTPGNWQTCSMNISCFSPNPPQHSTTISRDGQSMEFFADSGSFQQSFWFYDWRKTFTSGLPDGNAPLKYVKYEFDIHVDATSTATNSPQALEFQVEQDTASLTRNFAFQDTYHDSQMWRAFDKAAQVGTDDTIIRWQPVGIPSTFLNVTESGSDVWYHVILAFHLDASFSPPVIRHDAVSIYEVAPTSAPAVRQGTEYHNAHDAASATVTPLSNAVQLDTNSSGNQYHTWIDNMTITFMQ